MAAKKKIKKKSGKNSLLSAKNFVRGSNNKIYAISEARANLSGGELQSFSKWIAGFPYREVKTRLFFPPSPANIRDTALKPIVESDIPNWYSGLFSAFSGSLSEFISAKSKIQDYLNNGKHREVLIELNELEKKYGYSFWSISLRVGVLSVFEGLEAHKSYIQDILSSMPAGLPKFIIYYYGVRAEEKVSPPKYYRLIDQIFGNFDLSDELASYLDYFLRDVVRFDQEDTKNFYLISSGALFDQYEFFVKLMVENAISSELTKGWRDCCKIVVKSVDDHRLLKVLGHTDSTEFLNGKNIASTAKRDALLSGEVPEIEAGTDTLEDRFERCLIFPPIEKNPCEPNRETSKLALHTAEGEEEALRVFKRGMVLEGLDIGQWLGSVASCYLTSSEEDRRRSNFSRFFWNKAIDVYGLYSGSYDFNKELFKLFEVENTESLTLRWHGFWADKNTTAEDFGEKILSLNEQQRASVELVSLWREGRYLEALSKAKADIERGIFLDPIPVHRIVIKINLERENLKSAFSELMDAYFSFPDRVRGLPFLEIYDRLTKEWRRELKSSVDLPIFYHLLLEIFDQDVGNLCAFSYEDFIISRGGTKPSDIIVGDDDDKRKLIYFLRYVCVPDIMQHSIYFEQSKQLDEERVRICNMLIDLDPERSEIYEDELRGLVRNAHIQLAVKQLQQSKISIEENELRRWASETFASDYERLVDLINSGQKIAGFDYKENLYRALKDKKVDKSLFEIPENEAGQLLQDIVRQIISEAYFNQENGLDCYLSMRVRHGTLSGQLRNPLEEAKLITKRLSDGKNYQENDFWKSRLVGRLEDQDVEMIMSALSVFSMKFDEKVEFIADELIQIRRSEKEHALFSGPITSADILSLGQDVENGLTFKEFINHCFSLFWYAVDYDLKFVRKYFAQDVKPEFKMIFSDLESDISSFTNDEWVSNLRDASRLCFTHLQSSLDRVSEWFELPKPATSIVFDIDELIEIGLESVKALHSDFNPIVHKNVAEIPPLQNVLNMFSDIFFIIFENIYRHSGLYDGGQVVINASIDRGVLLVNVENELGLSEATLNWTKTKLEKIEQKIYEVGYRDELRTEGGTGFFKLRKLADPTGTVKKPVEFGLVDKRFFVTVRSPISIIEDERQERGDIAG
jgi:hypothetical protein